MHSDTRRRGATPIARRSTSRPAFGECDVLTPLSPDALASIAAGLGRSQLGDALVVPPGEDRAYVRLLSTAAYEAWLIAWRPSGALDLHDHGGSLGALHVVRGSLAERYVDGATKTVVRSRDLREAQSIRIPRSRIHEVWNPGPLDALSVHVYSPPLAAMTFFDRSSDGSMVPSRTVAVGEVP